MPAFVSASRDCDESLPLQDHTQDIARLYNDGSDSTHTGLTHNGGQGIFDPYTRQYVSTVVSSPHSAG